MKLNCSYYNQGICHSCTELSVSYDEQVQRKEETLTTLLGVSPEILLPTVRSELSGFRAKAKFVVTGSEEAPVIGLAGTDDLDAGREILECPLHDPRINEILPELKELIRSSKLPPYEIRAKKGEIKGIILYVSATSEIYVRLILRSKEAVDRIRKNLQAFLRTISQVKVFSLNIQPIPHAILEGAEEIFLTELTTVSHALGDKSLRIHPQGFVQTNTKIAETLYETAAEWTRALGARKFCELFSGQGAFSFAVAEAVDDGLGVEINAAAVERANATARENNLHHLKFLARDAAEVFPEVEAFNPDLLLVNPPRRGLGDALSPIQNLAVRSLIYSSCSAESLARDLEELRRSYTVSRLQIFDMFPHTKHFETLVLLERL